MKSKGRNILIPWVDSTPGNEYMVLYNVRTGGLVHKTTGVDNVAVTWSNAKLVSSTIMTTGFTLYSIPDLDVGTVYGFLLLKQLGDTAAATDTILDRGLFDPRNMMPYTNAVPTNRARAW